MKYYPPRFLLRRYELLKRIQPGLNFLEIGPGSFNLTTELSALFSSGVLVDYNNEALSLFNELNPEERSKLSLVIEDFSDFETEEKFKAVVACEVLEHVEDDEGFLKKVHQLLDDNGQLLFSVPARKKYWSVHDEGVGHLRRYEKKAVRRILEKSGYEVTDIVSYGFPFANMLRYPRILLAKKQQKHNSLLSKEEQTKESGLSQYRVMTGALGLICNKYTMLPFSIFSSLFNKQDYSNGYLVIAVKREIIERKGDA